MRKVRLADKLASFQEHWSPRIVAELNGQHVVPRGMEHRPSAQREVHVLLFEPAGTLNTGNVRTEQTVDVLETL